MTITGYIKTGMFAYDEAKIMIIWLAVTHIWKIVKLILHFYRNPFLAQCISKKHTNAI